MDGLEQHEGYYHDGVSIGQELFLLNYLHLVGIVVLYWDHFITFDKEINLVWRHPKSLTALCFFLNRYFAFITNIPDSFIPFLALSTTECLNLSRFREMSIVLTQIITGVIMIIRVYALFNRNLRILILLGATGLAAIIVSAWSVSAHAGVRVMIIGGCRYGLTESSAYRFAGSWISLFVFDLTVFALTLYYAKITRERSTRQTNLHVLVVRDGAMYFGIMALANLANIATYYLVEYWPLIPGALATFANCISITMISRLILNLLEQADEGIFLVTQPGADTHVALSSFDG
ncbi:hypothetical protein R3P38DRAFT_2906212 [Favolaschia claudopus]|uniref:DUF6533 domain-containing protein n=1 Tax=Favolaschia claudopus TaxID=2862362 RepID=A0AAW0CHX0_9AGAR